MSLIKVVLGITLLGIVNLTHLFGQKFNGYLLHYTSVDGLPSENIRTILQDSAGYIWIGTKNGLSKFNGTSFFNYRYDANLSGGISGSFIKDIYLDYKNRLWVLTGEGGVCILEKDGEVTNKFKTVINPKFLKNSREIGEDAFFKYADDKNCIIKTSKDGFLEYNFSDSSIKQINFLPEIDDSLNSFSAFKISNNSTNIFLFNREKYFLYDMQLRKIIYRSSALYSDYASKLDKQTRVSCTTDKAWFADKFGNYFSVVFSTGCLSKPGYVPLGDSVRLNFTHATNDDILRLVVNNTKLIELNTRTGEYIDYSEKIINKFSGKSTYVRRIYEDKNGVIWISTDNGVFVLNKALNYFKNYLVNDDKNFYAQFTNITCFMALDSNKLLVGSEEDFHLFDEKENKFQAKKYFEGKEYKYRSHSILKRNKEYYIANWGLQKFNPNALIGRRVEVVADSELRNEFFKRSFSTIYADTLDGEEAWWLPSWQNNLYLYFINSKKLFRYNSLNINGQKLKREFAFLRFAIKDKNGKIWIGSNNEGCYVIENYKKGITINYNADTGNVRLPTNKIYSGVLDKNGELWLIAHTAGVIHVKLYGLGEPQFELYDTRHGLDNVYLYDALIDNNNHLWISSQSGIERFDINNKKFYHYGPQDGIFDFQFATGCYKHLDGRFIFSSWNSFVSFYPDSVKLNSTPPSFFLKSIKVMNIENSSLLKYSHFTLPYNKNFVSFEIEAINFLQGNKNKFRYMLDGVDDNWVINENINFANYSGLPSGSYTFYYNVANHQNVWNATDKKISFTILPVWYKTNLFYFFVLAFAGTMFFLLYRYKLFLIKQKDELKLKIMVETQEEERKRIGRDLHDDIGAQLSTLKMFLTSLKTKKGIDKDRLYDESLAVLSNSITDIRNVLINLSPKTLSENGFMPAVEELANRINKTAAIKFELNAYGIKKRFNQQFENTLFRIVQELINNTLKHAEASFISLSILQNETEFTLMYEDNGNGCNLDDVINGYGLLNIKTRVQMYDGNVFFDSSMDNGFRCQIKFKPSDINKYL